MKKMESEKAKPDYIDLDKDGKADQCSVWAEGLNVPLSFEFGNGGVYVSEEPHMTFLKDTNGDGKADLREIPLTGFGCEDSHHALHDFAWTPDGDLIFRESIFHHTQVETPYGPVRQQNSGWFAWEPKLHRLTSFGYRYITSKRKKGLLDRKKTWYTLCVTR